jgi:hypothetical protein
MALRVISRRCSNSVAFGTKRTSNEQRLENRIMSTRALIGDNQLLELAPVILRPLLRVFPVGDFGVKLDVLHYL